jgi:putative flippase GtrA
VKAPAEFISGKDIAQFIKFGAVGISNTAISLAVYYLCLFMGIQYLAANTLAFIISVTNAYYWNHRFVFKKEGGLSLKSYLKTFASYGVTFLVSTALMAALVQGLGASEKLAPLACLCVTIPMNFLLNKFWSFK